MDNDTRHVVTEATFGAAGIATALAAGAAAARARRQQIQWEQRQARIESRARANTHRAGRNAALRQQIHALDGLIALASRKK